jgi:transposase InsO family protein
VGDATAIRTLEGWTYLAVILDVFSRRVVGWALSPANDTNLALCALRAALRLRRPPPGVVHHSDRGSPYASDAYRAELARHRMIPSMSRKGDCWDNAVAESFFSTLRAELIDMESYSNGAAAEQSIGPYIDDFYNLQRRHSSLGYLNPIEHELRCTNHDRTA